MSIQDGIKLDHSVVLLILNNLLPSSYVKRLSNVSTTLLKENMKKNCEIFLKKKNFIYEVVTAIYVFIVFTS